MKIKKKTSRSQAKKIKIEHSDTTLTNYSGIIPISRFMLDHLKIHSAFSDELGLDRGSNITYSTYEIVTQTLAGIFAGCCHMNQISLIGNDQVLQKTFGWRKSPCASTLGRYFHSFTMRQSQEIIERINQIRNHVWKKIDLTEITMDIDSTVKILYGDQEGGEKGYNPTARNKKSYHPLLSFNSTTKELVLGHLRSGDSYTGNGIVEFTREAFSSLSKKINKVFLRADSGFFNGDLFDFIEEQKEIDCTYLVKVKFRGLKEMLINQEWKETEHNKNISTTEFTYQCSSWSKPRRFVGIRAKIKQKKRAPQLFDESEIPVYQYACFVSNLDLEPMAIYKLYKKRAECENWIEEIKNQFYACKILTRNFWANDALFNLSALAYNIINWLGFLTESRSWREEFNTFRFWFIKVAGRLVRTGRKLILKLQKGYVFQKRWENIHSQILGIQIE